MSKKKIVLLLIMIAVVVIYLMVGKSTSQRTQEYNRSSSDSDKTTAATPRSQMYDQVSAAQKSIVKVLILNNDKSDLLPTTAEKRCPYSDPKQHAKMNGDECPFISGLMTDPPVSGSDFFVSVSQISHRRNPNLITALLLSPTYEEIVKKLQSFFSADTRQDVVVIVDFKIESVNNTQCVVNSVRAILPESLGIAVPEQEKFCIDKPNFSAYDDKFIFGQQNFINELAKKISANVRQVVTLDVSKVPSVVVKKQELAQ